MNFNSTPFASQGSRRDHRWQRDGHIAGVYANRRPSLRLPAGTLARWRGLLARCIEARLQQTEILIAHGKPWKRVAGRHVLRGVHSQRTGR